MAFRVEIAPRAFNDLDGIADYIKRSGSLVQAEERFNGMIEAIRTLGDATGGEDGIPGGDGGWGLGPPDCDRSTAARATNRIPTEANAKRRILSALMADSSWR
jgi:hypothetical protein